MLLGESMVAAKIFDGHMNDFYFQLGTPQARARGLLLEHYGKSIFRIDFICNMLPLANI